MYDKAYLTNKSRATYEMSGLLREVVDGLPQAASVVELGCGDLQLLKQIQVVRPDLDLHGVDVSPLPDNIELCGIKFYQRNVAEFEGARKFDLVLGVDVLEHLADPQALTITAAGLMAERGKLYVSVPSTGKLLLMGDANFYSDYTHVRPFNEKSLNRLLTDSGFHVREIRTFRPQTGWRSLRLAYYALRTVVSVSPDYYNAMIQLLGGFAVEAVCDFVAISDHQSKRS